MVEKTGAEAIVREIKRRTRKKYSSEEKIRIVLEGLRGEMSIAELCRKEGIHENVYYKWSKDFLEAGKNSLQSRQVMDSREIEASISSLTAFLEEFERHFSHAPICERKVIIQKIVDRIEIDREKNIAKCYLLRLPKGESKLVDEMIEKERTHLLSVPPTRFELVLQA